MKQYYSEELEQVKVLLPEPVQRIAELIGFPATARLLQTLGGTTFPIGKGLRVLGAQRVRMLKNAIGEDNARILMHHFGGEVLYLSRCDSALRALRNQSFICEYESLRKQGVSSLLAMTELCPKYGFSDRFAWGLLAQRKISVPNNQGLLF